MRALCLFLASALLASTTLASDAPFSGEWEIDLRTPAEKSARADCGKAGFRLTQVEDKISGDHWMATAGCGRVNEGREGSVVGVVRGGEAILTGAGGRGGGGGRG